MHWSGTHRTILLDRARDWNAQNVSVLYEIVCESWLCWKLYVQWWIILSLFLWNDMPALVHLFRWIKFQREQTEFLLNYTGNNLFRGLLIIQTQCMLRHRSTGDVFFIELSMNWVPPLPSDRQHPSYSDCLEVKREYYQNCSVLGCVTQCS